MDRNGWRSTTAYVALLAAAFVVSLCWSWYYGPHVDRSVYDTMLVRHRPPARPPESVLLVVDDRTLGAIPEGAYGLRRPLTEALRLVAGARPRAVVVDFLLADRREAAVDGALAEALRATPNVVIGSQLLPDGWEDPQPEFRAAARRVGHVHAQIDSEAARGIPLAQRFGQKRLWALSLEAFALSRGAEIVESTDSDGLQVGDTQIPASGEGRLMRVHFLPPGTIPHVQLKRLLDDPSLAAQFTDKVVFLGVTAQSMHDGQFTPFGYMSGIEINADAFETIAQRAFLTDVQLWVAVLLSMGFVASAGLAFHYLPGWMAVATGAAIIGAAMLTPYAFFTQGRVLPFAVPAAAAWVGTLTAAAYYYFVVRRNLRRSEMERSRYQQAMHFVTHEMRTPLSAIQGSSELISKYALSEEKRQQLSQLINSESKRLARMVEIFLNVERLSAGQMDLKREAIQVKDLVAVCVGRVRLLAERKQIAIALEEIAGDLHVTGDRELVEYACYNLLTNAVKYSPQRTQVTVSGSLEGGHARIAVRDQGIGMDQKEVRQIFRKFYRTKTAEESGEAGTGIGLSIVQQIVEQHGGEIEVKSQPGVGSCFTLVLPATAHPAVSAARS